MFSLASTDLATKTPNNFNACKPFLYLENFSLWIKLPCADEAHTFTVLHLDYMKHPQQFNAKKMIYKPI